MLISKKLAQIEDIILKKDFLNKLIKISWKNYKIEDLVGLGYVSVIKKWEVYFNNQINAFKNPYIIGWAYVNFQKFMFGWFEQYNKKWFIDQVSNIFTIYNLQYSKKINIVWLDFVFKKVKKEFLFGKKTKMINGFNIWFMDKERLFLEYVRDYIDYEDSFFVNIYKTLDKENLDKYTNKYPIKKVVLKIDDIKKCL